MFSNRKIILVTVLLIVLCIAAYVLLVIIPRRVAEQGYEGARQLSHDLEKALQFTPEIKVNNTIVIQQRTTILELATVSQKFHHRYNWSNTRLYSTKKIEVSGTFDAKVGFDLQEKMTIAIQDGKAIVTFPEPKLLSIELMGDLEFTDENGVWNWVNEDDRSSAINAFTQDARRFAAQTFLTDAHTHLEETLIEILKPYVDSAEIHIGAVTINRELKSEERY